MASGAAGAGDYFDGRLSIHGFGELQLRSLSDGYRTDRFYMSQWANVLNLEVEGNIAPNGWGPFDVIQSYTRIEARYDCIWTGCAIAPTYRYFGDRANQAPRNLNDGRTTPYSGVLVVRDSERIAKNHELLEFKGIPPFDQLASFGSEGIDPTLLPVHDARFAVKNVDASLGNAVFVLGPWKPGATIDPTGSLQTVPNPTSALPLRPSVGAPRLGGMDPHGLFIPSQPFVDAFPHYGRFDQNFGQADLAWNHGGSQRPYNELKETYLDLETLQGRLWMRIGRQDIVWGKTELFRTTDQFNPQDLALSSLPTLKESRVPLWSARAVYSLYDVGPLEDVRLEVAANFDRFQPYDVGRCGEPYTIWIACGKTFGLWAHGVSGNGIAGEKRPPAGYESIKGVEPGARVEFRYSRFSFQISDFWGWEDAPTIDYFHSYGRNVDPFTGQPLDVNGHPLSPSEYPYWVLRLHPGNRQLFDVACSVTVGITKAALPTTGSRCLVDILNDNTDKIALGLTPATGLGQVLGGSSVGAQIAAIVATGSAANPLPLVELNQDPNDGPPAGAPLPPGFRPTSLSSYLTTQQMALLGCGPYYGTNCDNQGIDLFNAEASVLLQSFPQFEKNGAVATRPVNGRAVVLPGARGPGSPAYTPLQDGCVGPGPLGCNAGDTVVVNGAPVARATSANALVNPLTGQPFANELAALSYNFLELVAALGKSAKDANGNLSDPGCDVNNPITCKFVQGVFAVAGITRPEVRAGGNGFAGRRDFTWSGGSEIEIQYDRRNVLGFAFDFAEDTFKTNWSVETTWFHGQPYARTDTPHGYSHNDTLNLTISVDRPTFVNFLNSGRTFFVNSQWFIRWIDGYRGGGAFLASGPFAALGTLSVATGYFQDRLLPSWTFVYDVASASGAALANMTYRFTPDFSGSVGIASFFGKPTSIPIPLTQAFLVNNGGDFKSKNRYDGLTPIAERDEIYLTLRYTF